MSSHNQQQHIPPLDYTKPKKVCLIVEPSPLTHVCGYSNRFKEVLKHLAKAGDSVEVITPETRKSKCPTTAFGFPVHWTWGFEWPQYKNVTISADIPCFTAYKVIKQLRPDLVHVVSPGMMAFVAIVYCRLFGIPLLMSYHTHLPLYAVRYLWFIPFIGAISWMAIWFAHSFADLTLVTSTQIKEQFTERNVKRVAVWKKAINTEAFHPTFESKEMRHKMTEGNVDDFLMVCVGRLAMEKQLKQLKEVLIRSPPNTRLCFVGDGPHREELERYFRGTNTYFAGQLLGETLSSAYASADAFVMPSDSETLGNVIMEAMACGTPCVAVRAGGIPDMIEDGVTSFLVPAGDMEEMTNCLNKLRDGKLRMTMGTKAREVVEEWGWDKSISLLRNIQYEQAIENFHRRREKASSNWWKGSDKKTEAA